MSAETVRNHYRRQGAEAEQERIVKVINTAKGSDCGCEYCKEHVAYLDQLIDLIKGEVK